LLFDTTSVTVIPETRKLSFNGAQATISDQLGNLLMATNGCWLSNALGDTMLNGSGLNPSQFTTVWCDSTNGIPYPQADLILPWPGDTTKYVLFHQTSDDPSHYRALNLFYTVIDMTLDGGLGGVDTVQKNISIVQDKLTIGLAACKHANGRDWWIVAQRDSSDIIYSILLTPGGIDSISSQSVGFPLAVVQQGQEVFSPDGTKFAFSTLGPTITNAIHDIRILDFDRCSGQFSNPIIINLTDSFVGFGVAFSPDSKLLYATSTVHVFQINIDSVSVDTVATYDGHVSPIPPLYSYFWTMYRAPDSKIYISTANSTLELHYIKYPDSTGISCDVKQHDLNLPCFQFRANVNHPNYYLGPINGSVCDSLQIGINEISGHDFHFSVSPNPMIEGYLRISYLLPQNKIGLFIMYDAFGREIYQQRLPQWSTLQQINLPHMDAGVYYTVIISDSQKATKKVVVME